MSTSLVNYNVRDNVGILVGHPHQDVIAIGDTLRRYNSPISENHLPAAAAHLHLQVFHREQRRGDMAYNTTGSVHLLAFMLSCYEWGPLLELRGGGAGCMVNKAEYQ